MNVDGQPEKGKGEIINRPKSPLIIVIGHHSVFSNVPSLEL